LEEGGDVVPQLVMGLLVIVHHMTAEIATGGDVAAELGGLNVLREIVINLLQRYLPDFSR